MQKPASEIEPGMKILLRDEETQVEIVDRAGDQNDIMLFWLWDMQRRYMHYEAAEMITVIP